MEAKRFLSLFVIAWILVSASAAWLRAQEKSPDLTYEIWVDLDDQNKMLSGKEEIIWRNTTQDDVGDMWFHLYFNAFKNKKSTMLQEKPGLSVREGTWGWIDVTTIQLADGTDLSSSMEFMREDKPKHPEDQTVMRILFPEPVKPGEAVHLQLTFLSKIPRTIERSGYYQSSYFIAQWFPKPGVYEEGVGWNCHEYHDHSEFYADFAHFTVHITVPENFVVGSSGKELKVVSDPESKTATHTYQQNKIHDFAWMTAPHYLKIERDFKAVDQVSVEEYEEVARALQLPVEEIKLPNVKMFLLIAPEHEKQIDRHFKALEAALKYYGLWYGPYPYETITMVDPPFRTGSGGMEYPTFFTGGTSILASHDVLSPEGVIIHEFGHGYWYGMVANNEFEEAWLDEGINTYSTGKVAAAAYGPGEIPLGINRIPLNGLFKLPRYYDYHLNRIAGLMVVKMDPITTYSWQFYNSMSYGGNVYMRAATCLETLERLVGNDTMLRILRRFQMRYRFRHPKTQDFIDVVNEITQRDFNWFFEEFFFGTHDFDYSVSSLTSTNKKKHFRGVYDVSGEKEELTKENISELKDREKETQTDDIFVTTVKVRRLGEARVGGDIPVELKVVFEDESEEHRYWKGQGRWKSFTFEKPVKARYAQIDPDTAWLLDSNISNNSCKLKRSCRGVFKFASQLIFFIQNGIHLFTGLI